MMLRVGRQTRCLHSTVRRMESKITNLKDANKFIKSHVQQSEEEKKKKNVDSENSQKDITEIREAWKDSKKERSNLHGHSKSKTKISKDSSGMIQSKDISYHPVEVKGQPPVAPLSHNLDRVLFNPGIHFLKDPRTEVYNFNPFLENIMSIRDFDFSKIPTYVPSGKDSKLAQLAKQRNQKFIGSTSSLTGILTKFHHALSHQRPPNLINVSKNYPHKAGKFAESQLRPVSIFLRHNHKYDTFAIDADRGDNSDQILSVLGMTLETMLTTPKSLFEKYHKSKSHLLEASTTESTYNYTQCGSLLMRSQLDCHDERLPGTGMFDLKTRAVSAARYDLDYVQINDGTDYQIKSLYGQYESFENEWVDLTRTQLMKYSLQARIGRMDGIMIAYHNIRRMFGFQYVPLSAMDQVMHSYIKGDSRTKSTNSPKVDASATAEEEFKLSIKLMEQVLKRIVKRGGPTVSYNIVFNVPKERKGELDILVKPMREKHINKIQTECNEDSEHMVCAADSKSYKKNNDPNTIWKHAERDPGELPPDVEVYTLKLKSFIDGVRVEEVKYPTLYTNSEDWKVQWKIVKQQPISASSIFLYTFKDKPYVMREITSTPQLERLEEMEQKEVVKNALGLLNPPGDLQQLLRRLGDLGTQNVARESPKKVIWQPRDEDLQ